MTEEEKIAEMIERERLMTRQWSVQHLKGSAINAIQGLYARAVNEGNQEAVAAMVDVASYVAQSLKQELDLDVPSRAGTKAVEGASANALLWPSLVPAVEEMRDRAIEEGTPANLGDSLPIKTRKRKGKGRTREFLNNSQTGFAYNVFCSLEASRDLREGLEPLSRESLPTWIIQGVEFVAERGDLFPETVEMRSAIKKRMENRGQDEDAARTHVVRTMLKKGFGQLLKD